MGLDFSSVNVARPAGKKNACHLREHFTEKFVSCWIYTGKAFAFARAVRLKSFCSHNHRCGRVIYSRLDLSLRQYLYINMPIHIRGTHFFNFWI
jgi:hypothetical protein